MRTVLSREQMQAFDRMAIEKCQVPGLLLMENAGRGAAQVVTRELDRDGASLVCVVCGPGNNGGDGYVVARRLRVAGRNVVVLSLVPTARLAGEARVNADAWRGIGGELLELDGRATADRILSFDSQRLLLVDALLGTGLDREVREDYRVAIEAMNGARARKVALDLPSGLHANTGAVLGLAVRADATVTFGHPKLGLLTTSGLVHSGVIHVVDIGVPGELWTGVGKSADWVTEDDARALGPRRPRDEHKASAGRVAVIAGSLGKVGAAVLAARGALRAGAGLVTIATHADAADTLEGRLPEAMTWRLETSDVQGSVDALLSGNGACLIGPGLGIDERAEAIVYHAAQSWAGTITLDADAITIIAHDPARLRSSAGRRILTPHSGELARLLGVSSDEVERDRFDSIRRAVELTGAIVVLKGPATLIAAPDRTPRVVTSGSSVLATGGTGDVLGGVIAALSTKLEPFDAASLGAWLHGRAAVHWSGAHGFADRGLLAHELADALPVAAAELTTEPSAVTG